MKNYKVYFYLTLCVLFWSGNFVLGRYIKDDITPYEMVFFRWMFASLIVLPIFILRFKKIINVLKNNFVIILLLSFLGISSFNTILYIALTSTSSTNALIINSSIPLVIVFLSFLILKQNINLYQILGIILSTFGVIYLILKGDLRYLYLFEFNKGDLLVLLSSFVWALYSIFIKFKPKELNGLEFFTTIVIFGFIIITPLYFYQGYTLEREMELLKNNYYIFIYVSLFASFLSYFFWNKGINDIGANKTGQFTHLMPIFGSILAYVFLDESLKYYHIVGAIFIAIGIYVSIFKDKIKV